MIRKNIESEGEKKIVLIRTDTERELGQGCRHEG